MHTRLVYLTAELQEAVYVEACLHEIHEESNVIQGREVITAP